MNSLTLLALVKAAPTIKATMKSAGDNQIAAFPVEVAAYRQNDPPMPLQVTAWGNLAADAGTSIRPGGHYVLTGRLRLEKNRPPELQISAFHGVTPLDAPGVNIVSLVGRAGRDPEARYFESGSMVSNLSLAVNRNSRDDAPDWFNLEIWGKQAQIAADYVRKGSLLGITGSFKLELWTDRSTGEERSKPVIRVDRLDLLGSKRDAEAGGGAGAGGYQPDPDDDSLPF
jgi:single-strand DNA-binding protein